MNALNRRDFIKTTLAGAAIASTARAWGAEAVELRIPAFTAYLVPRIDAAHVGKDGITGWASDDHILWGGILGVGTLGAAVMVRLPAGESVRLKLTLGEKSSEARVVGGPDPVFVKFGPFESLVHGYQTLQLAGVNKSGKTFGDVLELILSGPATADAFFNLKPRRNAASVHLGYPLAKGQEAIWFYNELTPRADPVATYYEACGFARGYFGMQVNGPEERRIIFSVWDSGHEGKDRSKVRVDDRVKLLAKGQGVFAGDFGNEGTGGHSHLKYMWKTGDTQRFLVTARADGDATIYSGYFFFREQGKWGLIASFRAPHDGKLLRGLYSFNENFGGANGHLRRLCEFGNQWIKTPDGKWIELTEAHFTHDATGGKDRRDFGAGVTQEGRFYLSNGGFVAEPVKYGQSFTRPAGNKPPEDIVIP